MHNRFVHLALVASILVAPLTMAPGRANAAIDIVLSGPPGSSEFGQQVIALSNGNVVVTDPTSTAGGQTAAGAVYLYDGATGALISALTGSADSDNVGGGGVIALPSGNFVVLSPYWDGGSGLNVGAVTWVDGEVGLSGVVDVTNSLIGSQANDRVGIDARVLANGNVVVRSPFWANGTAQAAGAITWIDGAAGQAGAIGPSNSLVGSQHNDQVGFSSPVVALDNGNYLVMSDYWDNGILGNAGAVTWGNGSTGTVGVVSPANSLVGTVPGIDFVQSLFAVVLSDGDYVVTCPRCAIGGLSTAGAVAWGSGSAGVAGEFSATNSLVGAASGDLLGVKVFPLTNGNYVVSSPAWDNGGVADVGAVTWASGATGRVGQVSAANSLIGSTYNDRVGDDDIYDNDDRVWALTNGNYVVCNGTWDNGAVIDAGAVTWGNGTSGTVGVVSPSNSLVGSTMNDRVGWDSVTVLNNGNYVVASPEWDDGARADVGAATWGDGTTGVTGTISAATSLIGSSVNDRVGYSTALTNGHYVVRSSVWDNAGVSNAGAATWANGQTGLTGTISASNSLIGSQVDDSIGSSVFVLANGNYVLPAPNWRNSSAVRVGAITWGNGATGVTGTISSANSLVGQTAGDIGGAVMPLANGNYVVANSQWDNGAVVNAGAITWANGATGVTGTISSANSLVGTAANDLVGSGDDWGVALIAFPDGNYAVKSPAWDNGAIVDAGAVTWGNGTQPLVGNVSTANSLVGSSSADSLGAVYEDLTYLTPGAYALTASRWDFGALTDVGAVAFGPTATGIRGPLTGAHSVHGSIANVAGATRVAFDSVNAQFVIGLPAENQVILRRANLAPMTSAGPEQTIGTNSVVTLDGTASTDPDGDMPLTYAWTQTGGPSVALSDPTAAQPTFTAPSAPTTLTFSLRVADAWGEPAVAAASVVINVVVPVAPTGVTLQGPTRGAVNRGQTFVARVSNASATPPLTYTWEVSGRAPSVQVGGLSDTFVVSDTVAGTRAITVSVTNSAGQSVSATQSIAFVEGNQTDVTAVGGGTLTYGGVGQGTTAIQVPSGAVTETTTLLLETYAPASQAPGFSFAGTAFALSALREGAPLAELAFSNPVTITLTYSDEQLTGQSEGTLRLFVRSGSDWIDAATTCAPPSAYVREPQSNRVSVAICHLSEYAWAGQQQVFLPLLRR